MNCSCTCKANRLHSLRCQCPRGAFRGSKGHRLDPKLEARLPGPASSAGGALGAENAVWPQRRRPASLRSPFTPSLTLHPFPLETGRQRGQDRV